MARYFIEVAYKGTRYSGFQVQDNADTIQSELEKAMEILFRKEFHLTGSSRTDAGVHALQNFFHFDADLVIAPEKLYNLNALLPNDIVVVNIFKVKEGAHCRFQAIAREYRYYIYQRKDPFLEDNAWFYPYQLDMCLLNSAAAVVKNYTDFTSFSKRNTQVHNFHCDIQISEWLTEKDTLVYHVKANRFLRGMVRGLVGTMLKVGRQQLSVEGFKNIIEAKDCTLADFSTPAHGLFLVAVHYQADILL